MAYQKTQWQDHIEGVQVGTPVNAANMNKIEEGIAAACAIGDAEGTWTPEVVEMRSQVGGCTYDTRVGYYIRIGNLVLATFNVSVSKKSTGTNWSNTTMVCVKGLPGTRPRQDNGYNMGAQVTLNADAPAIAATTQMMYGTVAFAKHDGMLYTSNLGDGFILNGSIAYMTT